LRRIIFLVIAGCAFAVTEMGRFVCRPWVREHGINDYGLTGSIGNLGGIVVQIFVVLAIVGSTRRKSFGFAAFMAAGYVVYEFLQPYLPRGTFDWNDVYATVIGFVFSVPVLYLVWKLLPEQQPAKDAGHAEVEDSGEQGTPRPVSDVGESD
jgi:hypothetical protein